MVLLSEVRIGVVDIGKGIVGCGLTVEGLDVWYRLIGWF
jgi:hypothetical protein